MGVDGAPPLAMDISLHRLSILVEQDDALQATLLAPRPELPGILFVHGWGGNQEQDLSRARQVAALGTVCMTFDLRGHRANAIRKDTITRAQNLQDLCAAYDWLASQPQVDGGAIGLVGVSYGGYLAALLSELRPVCWLALRSPALYLDRDWDVPKARLHEDPELLRYRRRAIAPDDNLALRACSRFRGDVLLVQAEHDEIVPQPVIDNYARAFGATRSLTRRLVPGADHGFSEKPAQRQYTNVLVTWMTEMIVGARGAIAAGKVRDDKQQRRALGAP